jgi:hypothetical protein
LKWQAGSKAYDIEHSLMLVLQELQSAFAALQQSRVALEERDFLIATHERSEAALAGHAATLTSGLQSAAANVEALFTRCEPRLEFHTSLQRRL